MLQNLLCRWEQESLAKSLRMNDISPVFLYKGFTALCTSDVANSLSCLARIPPLVFHQLQRTHTFFQASISLSQVMSSFVFQCPILPCSWEWPFDPVLPPWDPVLCFDRDGSSWEDFFCAEKRGDTTGIYSFYILLSRMRMWLLEVQQTSAPTRKTSENWESTHLEYTEFLNQNCQSLDFLRYI